MCVYLRQRHPDMEKYILTFVRGSGSVQVHLSTILKVQVWFRFTEVKFCWFRFGSGSPKWNGSFGFTVRVQVRFGFTKMKRFIRVYGSGSGSVRHPAFYITEYEKITIARQTDQLKREPNLQPWQSEPDFLLVSILLDIIPRLQLHFMS